MSSLRFPRGEIRLCRLELANLELVMTFNLAVNDQPTAASFRYSPIITKPGPQAFVVAAWSPDRQLSNKCLLYFLNIFRAR